MNSLAYKIDGLDCAEEVAVLKRAVGPLVGGDHFLDFDVLNGKMTIQECCAPIDAALIRDTVSKTGMRATPWDQYVKRTQSGQAGPFWSRHGRLCLAALSGLCIGAGFLVHSIEHGFVDAFSHDHDHGYPLASKIAYLGAFVAGAWFIAPKAIYSIRSLRPDMNLLMVVAAIGAMIIGEWMEAASVAFLFAVALLLESWSVGRARRAINTLLSLSPAKARYRCPHDGDIEERPVAEVPFGAEVLVRPGEKVPLDGIITTGSTTINEAAITGESMPKSRSTGDEVFAGTMNQDGAFEFRVTRSSDDTTLARITKMVGEAQQRRAPSEQWVETFARYYTPAMMGLALLIGVVPPLLFGEAWLTWIYEALVILVIACPCALVISTPVSIVAGLTTAARAGVLIKGGMYLEIPARLRAIAFDKTGTMTYGRPTVQRIVPLNGHSEHEILERAAALETHSDHPLARAILLKANTHGVAINAAAEYQLVQGKGAEGLLNNRSFWIGSHRFLHEKGGETPECHDTAVALEDAGHSVVAIGNDDHVCGLISVADSVRENCAPLIREMKREGVEHVVMLTGDNKGTAQAVALLTGVDAYSAELLPHEKVEAISALVERYGMVAMVGDGVNDAPAMAASSVGIAMAAAGSDAAIETADIALMSDDLGKIPWLIRHSRRTLRTIKQNIFFALGLKAAFIVMALFGMATLWMAIAADMGASLLVIANGLRLLKYRD